MSDYYRPNRMQIQSAVKGDDRYRPRARFPWWALFLIGVGVYGLYWVLTNN